MKRTLLYTLGLLVLGAAIASAQQPPRPTTPPAGQGVGPNFVDADGDGICDNFQARHPNGQKAGKGRGPGSGMGNNGAGPRDGTGYGAGAGRGTGTGTCTGSCTMGTGQGGGRQYRGGRR